MTTPFVTRAGWGARPRTQNPPAIRNEGMTLHHGGASPWPRWVDRTNGTRFAATTDHNSCAPIIRSWQAFHMDVKGWTDLAYNSVFCPHGVRFEGRGPGKRSGANGTNIGNSRSCASVYIGGTGDPLTDGAKQAALEEAERFGSRLRWQHSNWKSTECAGDHIRNWQSAGFPPPPQGEEFDMDDEARLRISAVDQVLARIEHNVQVVVDEMFHGPEIENINDMPDTDQRKVNFWGLMAGGKRLGETEDRIAAMEQQLAAILDHLGVVADE